MSTVLAAAGMEGEDRAKLRAFIQSQDDDDDDDEETGAPSAANYEMKETIPVEDVLRGMKEKADGESADLTKAEQQAKHSFGLLKGSLEAQLDADTKDLGDEKSASAEATQAKSQAEGDLSMTNKDLATANDALATTHHETVAADHEASIRARSEELKVIATAKKILEESTGGAVSNSYSLPQIKSGARNTQVVETTLAAIKKLVRKHKSLKLAQLASKISTVIAYGGNDVFKQVKEMILKDIEALKKEAEDDATEKAYCDEELAKTEAKKVEP